MYFEIAFNELKNQILFPGKHTRYIFSKILHNFRSFIDTPQPLIPLMK